MPTITPTRRRIAMLTSCLLLTLATAPAAFARPVAGPDGGASRDATATGDWNDMVPVSPEEPVEVVRTVIETVGVGVPHLAAVAIGLMAFAVAWVLATLVASRRTHRPTTG